ncbi:hypothetical protein [Streptomyces sp. NPDC052107]|uniref:hypothetical protein n=1 Tax=Streptomyces sp. NPDC052107 TaxID=3155632 RepID=UPI00343DBCAB
MPVTNGSVPASNTLTFSAPGTFYSQATYSGDGNNTGAMSECVSEPLIVARADVDIATQQRSFPQDSTTVSATAGGMPTGTVAFKLYGPTDMTCNTTPVHTEDVTLDNSGHAGTSDTIYHVAAANDGGDKWQVTYNGDGTRNAETSTFGAENATINVSGT